MIWRDTGGFPVKSLVRNQAIHIGFGRIWLFDITRLHVSDSMKPMLDIDVRLKIQASCVVIVARRANVLNDQAHVELSP